MRKIVLVFIAVIFTVSGFAQKSADIGIWGGSSTYIGDIKEAPPMQTFNLNFGAFFRYNFNARMAMRAQFLTGNHSAEGWVEDIVDWNFSKKAQDISFMMEINYLKYILGERKAPVTPYIMGGLGIVYFPYFVSDVSNIISDVTNIINDIYHPIGINPKIGKEFIPMLNTESVVTMSIPFGFGVKFSVGQRIGVGIEYQMRKLLNDKLDDLDDPLSFETVNNDGDTETIKYSDFLHNNDWPGYLGLNVTYKIDLDRKACPAYDRKYW
jgi:opacity protein-like surface antigen